MEFCNVNPGSCIVLLSRWSKRNYESRTSNNSGYKLLLLALVQFSAHHFENKQGGIP